MAAEANIIVRLSDGRKAGNTLKELRQEANRLTKEINNLPVGSAEFVKKSKDLQKVNGRLKEVRREVSGVGKANNNLIASFAQYLPFGGHIQSLAGGFGALTGATNGFGFALKAIPLLALIGLIAKAVHWFAQTQAAMDGITSVTRPLHAIFQRFIGLMQETVGRILPALTKAFDDPIGTLKELGRIIIENVINRFEALGVMGRAIVKILNGEFREGFKELGNGVIQVTTGIENGIDKIGQAAASTQNWINQGIEAGQRLDELQKSIEKQEIVLARRRGELNDLYERSKEIAQDQSRTEEERLAAAKQAQQAQNELEQLTLKFLDTKIEKMRLEHSLNDTSREDELELARLEAERSQAGAQAARKRASARNLENTINKQIAVEEAKRQEEIRKKAEEQLAKELEAKRNLQDMTIAIMDEGVEKEIAQIELATQRKIEALIGSEEQIREQKVLLKELEAKQIAEVEKKYLEQSVRQKQKADEKKKASEEKYQEFVSEMTQSQLETATDFFATSKELLASDEKSKQKNAGVLKAFTIGDISTRLAAEIQGIWENANKNPLNALFPGSANLIAGIKTALASARAGVAIGKVKAQKYNAGGILTGRLHSQGGIPGYISSTGEPIEMEDGEIILNRRVGMNPFARKLASDLNAAFGGRRFELGGIVNPFNQSPTSSAAPSGSAMINLDSTNERLDNLTSEFRDFKEEISTWASNLKVINNLQETEQGLSTLQTLREESSI